MNHSNIPLDPTKEYAPWVYEHGLQRPYGECQCGCGEKTDLATITSARRGHIKGLPMRYIQSHNALHRYTPEERFWKKVNKGGSDDCWLWTGGRSSAGYGMIAIDGKHTHASRYSYELAHGLIPDNLFVCHHCDNPLCVNPKHLWLGTAQDNTSDMVQKGRVARGEKLPQAKLTRQEVIEIRRLAAQGHTHLELAEYYGVSRRNIGSVVNRENWAHVP